MPLLSPLQPTYPLSTSKVVQWGQLSGASQGLAISNLAQQTTGIVLVITPDPLTAARLEDELRFFQNAIPVLSFSDWEVLPYDHFSPHQDIVSQRLLTLYQLPRLTQAIVLISIRTLLHFLPPPEFLEQQSFVLRCGDKLNLHATRMRLEKTGYQCVTQVYAHGEFAVRGSLLDVYPMGSTLPYRIDLFDEDVDSIRTFDPDTQRTLEVIQQINLLPAHEFPLTEEGIATFRQNWREHFAGNPSRCPTYQNISSGLSSQGIEYYLPLFFAKTASLFDYLPREALIVRLGDIITPAEQFWQEVKHRYEQYSADALRPLLPPAELFMSVSAAFQQIGTYHSIKIQAEPVAESSHACNFATQALPFFPIQHKAEHPFKALEDFLLQTRSRVLFCAESAGRREALMDIFNRIAVQPTLFNSWPEFLAASADIGIIAAPLDQGLSLLEPALELITEAQLFGEQVLQRRRRSQKQTDTQNLIRDLAELQVGAPVVHIDHGVGRYLGLQVIKAGQQEGEYLTLEYAGKDKLYIPVTSLHLLSRYSGLEGDHAPLHRLGSEQWQKAKRKAAEQIRDVAAELLALHAKRAARPGTAYPLAEQYAAFAADFPFEETPDQKQAIAHVVADMTTAKAMDRLVCGDVGFGKTEVAMRAAFIAVQAGKQVAILVPTTLLAQQHYDNFRDRFADWPIRVEVLSRFRTNSEQEASLQALQDGKVDIMIGTHKLLQKDVAFKDLGLVIIDEEHRFGVHQKERLKALRAEVDILTLTATPIPRTLNMALAGMRDLSIIATPPARRLAVKTFVHDRDSSLIREAVLREILRGGQVYFLHNNVETIEKTARELTELIPEARIAIAHGQVRERELEHIMADFYHQRFNVLVCTTIIETGIDIPSANTIIIERADKLGLAQLHQLRGRVGRSHHQAYAYLLTPAKQALTIDAQKRLDAIAALEDLGAGFTLATQDLEIRGAGELLGEEQSGNMNAIGFSLYMEMLERAVDSLKTGKILDLETPLPTGAEVDLQIPVLIPEAYLPDVHIRLQLYKKIANAATLDELTDLQAEIIDRFGALPQQTKNLLQVTALKITAQPLGIRKIEANAKGGRIEFVAKLPFDPMVIIGLIQQQPAQYKLDAQQRLCFNLPSTDAQARLQTIQALLEQLQAG